MFYDKLRKRMVACWAFAVLLLPVAVAGCSRPMGSVSGKVACQNQPLPAGSVTFVHADGTTVSGAIKDGSYSLSKVPAGPCTVLVVSLPPPRGMWNPQTKEIVGGEAPNKRLYAIPIPPRYNDPQQSDLHREVKSGSQTYDIDMKP